MIPHPHSQDVHVLLPGICACYLIWQKGLCRCRLESWNGVVILDFFFFFGHVTWLVEYQFPDQGLNPGPWQWECKVLTTGPPGNSCLGYLSGCNALNPKGPRSERGKWMCQSQVRRCEDGSAGWSDVMADTEEEGRGHEPRGAGGPWKSRKQTLPWSLQKIYSLILAKWDLFQTYDLQKL